MSSAIKRNKTRFMFNSLKPIRLKVEYKSFNLNFQIISSSFQMTYCRSLKSFLNFSNMKTIQMIKVGRKLDLTFFV